MLIPSRSRRTNNAASWTTFRTGALVIIRVLRLEIKDLGVVLASQCVNS